MQPSRIAKPSVQLTFASHIEQRRQLLEEVLCRLDCKIVVLPPHEAEDIHREIVEVWRADQMVGMGIAESLEVATHAALESANERLSTQGISTLQ